MSRRTARSANGGSAPLALRTNEAFARWVLAFLMLSVGAAAPLEGQGMGSKTLSGFRLEIGAIASTPLVEDGNGVSVRRGIGPAVSGDVLWTITEQTMFVATLRGSIAPLQLRSMEHRWSPGSTRQFDFAVRLEEDVASSFVVSVGLVGALIHGPKDVIPFRLGGGSVYAWGPELSIARSVARDGRLDMVVGGDAVRIGASGGDARLVGGWIGRLRLGIRHAL